MKGRRKGQRGSQTRQTRQAKPLPFALRTKLRFTGIKGRGRITREFYSQRTTAQPLEIVPQPVRPTARSATMSAFASWPEHVQRAWKAAVKSKKMAAFIRDFPLYAGQMGLKQKPLEFNAG